jgi:uncharacterized protein YdhG (YjbR/CyaY superfamily)
MTPLPKSKPTDQAADTYIAKCPEEVRPGLAAIREAIRSVAPGAAERTDYFQMPGYSYPGFDYDGMFAWFSFKKPYLRLHVRPPVLQDYRRDVAAYPTTKAVVSFPMGKRVPVGLVKKLTKASLAVMRNKAKPAR